MQLSPRMLKCGQCLSVAWLVVWNAVMLTVVAYAACTDGVGPDTGNCSGQNSSCAPSCIVCNGQSKTFSGSAMHGSVSGSVNVNRVSITCWTSAPCVFVQHQNQACASRFSQCGPSMSSSCDNCEAGNATNFTVADFQSLGCPG